MQRAPDHSFGESFPFGSGSWEDQLCTAEGTRVRSPPKCQRFAASTHWGGVPTYLCCPPCAAHLLAKPGACSSGKAPCCKPDAGTAGVQLGRCFDTSFASYSGSCW